MKKLFFIAMLALLSWLVIGKRPAPGVRFTLINVGPATLESVQVEVTGKSYRLGDLPPGSSKSLTLAPTGDSHIELAFSTDRRLKIDSYFQPGYRGRVQAEVTAQAVVSVTDETSLPMSY